MRLSIHKYLSVLGLLFVGVTSAPAADFTNCPIVQVCPLKYCPHIDSDNNEYKQAVYTEGCVDFAREQDYQFIKYVSGPAPQCMMVVRIEGEIDCTLLQ